jgi:CRP/FNR family cyclic AMP-dependent transcriptional regulator
MRAKRKPPPPDFDLKTFLATVNGERSISDYRKGEKVFSQGDPVDAVFYIQEGSVKVTVVSARGKEAVVAMQGAGDFFGEGCLNGQPLRLATVAAMTESVIMRIDKASIVRVLHDEPAFPEFFMRHLLLLLMAHFGREGRPEPVIAKANQETLAEMIGTTRSRVSHFMNKFRKLGFIEYNGHLEVHTSLLNMVLREPPEIRRGAGSED